MASSYFSQPLSVKLSFTTQALACAGMAIFAVTLMTEPGQLLNLNRDWIISYYQYKWLYGVLDLALFAGVVYLGLKHRIWRPVRAFFDKQPTYNTTVGGLPTFLYRPVLR